MMKDKRDTTLPIQSELQLLSISIYIGTRNL